MTLPREAANAKTAVISTSFSSLTLTSSLYPLFNTPGTSPKKLHSSWQSINLNDNQFLIQQSAILAPQAFQDGANVPATTNNVRSPSTLYLWRVSSCQTRRHVLKRSIHCDSQVRIRRVRNRLACSRQTAKLLRGLENSHSKRVKRVQGAHNSSKAHKKRRTTSARSSR